MPRARRSSAHAELLLAQLPSSFVWTASPELHVTSAGGAALSVLGIGDAETVVGQKIDALLEHARGRDSVLDAHRRALEGVASQMTRSTKGRAFDIHIEPLRAGDQVVGVAGIALDASKRHAAERALVESEARFRTLVERLPICTYVNPIGFPIRTSYISPYVETLLGYPVERWLEEDDFWLKILHPEDREAVTAAATRTHSTGEPFHLTYRMIGRDGHAVQLLDETVPVSDEHGQPLFLQGFLLDVGERRSFGTLRLADPEDTHPT